MSFAVRADRRLIRSEARCRRFVRVELTAPASRQVGRRPVSLAFVVDRSGSMQGDKIAKAREAAIQGIRLLQPTDRFAVVAYDHEVELVVPSTFATEEAKKDAERRVAFISERGNTDLHAGWARGCQEAERGLGEDAVARCLLLTDGLANEGITSSAAIVERASARREHGVATSAFGIGADFDEVLLSQVARCGGGNFHFVEGAAVIPTFVAAEVGETLAVTAHEVELVVDAGDATDVLSLNDFPWSRDGDSWRIQIGSLFGGQTLDPVVRVTFPPGEIGATREVRLRVRDREGAMGDAGATLVFTYASADDNTGQERDRLVDRRVAALFAARAGREALALNRAGRLDEARELLSRCVVQVRRFAADDPELQAVVRQIEGKIGSYSARLDPLTHKTLYHGETMSLTLRPGLWSPPAVEPAQPRRPLVVRATRDLEPVVRPALDQLARADVRFRFVDLQIDDDPPRTVTDKTLGAGAEISLVDAAAPEAAGRIHVVFTRRRLGDEALSHWHELRRTAVVSMADWNGDADVPPQAFAAYEIALNELRLRAPGFDPEALRHDTRGCFFDTVETRPELELRLRGAQVCPPCCRALAAIGVPAGTVTSVFGAVRLLAAAPAVVH
jgi:Ca-activated chloride channel family protein